MPKMGDGKDEDTTPRIPALPSRIPTGNDLVAREIPVDFPAVCCFECFVPYTIQSFISSQVKQDFRKRGEDRPCMS